MVLASSYFEAFIFPMLDLPVFIWELSSAKDTPSIFVGGTLRDQGSRSSDFLISVSVSS